MVTQLNFVVFCACGVSIEHMNAKKTMIRSTYCFHDYMRIVLINTILHITMKMSHTFVVSITLVMT